MRQVRLAEYLTASGEEDAARQANAWIKSLRHARVDGVAFRERFTYLGDSLWWFAELYLHKERAILSLFRSIHAVRTLLERETPETLHVVHGDRVVRLIVPQLAGSGRAAGSQSESHGAPALAVPMDVRSTSLMLAALGSPRRPWQPVKARTTVAAFVHRAFWRSDADDSSGESYVGPVLSALEQRLPVEGIRHVGLGPSRNFRARRWWQPSAPAPRVVLPVEELVPRQALAGSVGLWAARHAMRRALWASQDLRSASRIHGCDCWPIVKEALAGIALLQFPWSARAMDEAGAALDALQPAVALTYAEAGGWGRAIALEARRRRIPLAGLQHGFIYRHWLNYLHEPDEMQPFRPGSPDTGFPRPTTTLLFDEYAARHLAEAGRFPRESLTVTGSPKLDALAAACRDLSETDIDAARDAGGGNPVHPLVLLVTKYTEVAAALPGLLDALQAVPDARLAIKTHPAETPDPYVAATAGHANVRVLPASTPLAPLLRASAAIVTVNSTVALDAMALGIPALTVGLPNNLSPFVEAGALAGATTPEEIATVLRSLLYDDVFRQRLAAASSEFAAAHKMLPDGRAAERQAAAVLGLAAAPASG